MKQKLTGPCSSKQRFLSLSSSLDRAIGKHNTFFLGFNECKNCSLAVLQVDEVDISGHSTMWKH